MVKEAERFAEEDRRKREDAETRNRADTLVYQTERMLKDVGDKISADERGQVEAKLKALKDAIAQGEVAKISAAVEELQQASHKLAEAMYAKAAAGTAGGGASGGAQSPGGEAKAGDEVIDVDYKRKDEKSS